VAFEEALRFDMERLNPDSELKIDASTSRCRWLGERMDYSTAIESMQFREEAAAKAAAAPSSLKFVFVGVAIVLPFTIAYTIFVYRIFHGKATSLSYGEQD